MSARDDARRWARSTAETYMRDDSSIYTVPPSAAEIRALAKQATTVVGGLLAEVAAVEARTTHHARTLVDTTPIRARAEHTPAGQSFIRRAEVLALCDAVDEVAEMVAADVRDALTAARRRLAERAASYENTADRLAAKGFGDDASCMRTVAKELREVARELLA